MTRALSLLGIGIVVAVLVAVLITPVPMFRTAIVPVLITTGVGVLVMAVVARRRSLREREEQLRDASTDTTQEPDRG